MAPAAAIPPMTPECLSSVEQEFNDSIVNSNSDIAFIFSGIF